MNEMIMIDWWVGYSSRARRGCNGAGSGGSFFVEQERVMMFVSMKGNTGRNHTVGENGARSPVSI